MRSKRRSFEVLLVLIVFGVYAIGSLFICTVGATTYRDVTVGMQSNYDLRTGVLYLAEKTRQNDIAGAVRVEQYQGADALVLTEQRTGKGYETWIFVYEDKLCEVLIAPGSINELSVSQLQSIMPMKSMRLTLDEANLLSIDLLTIDNISSSITLKITSKSGNYYPPPESVEDESETMTIPGDGEEPETLTIPGDGEEPETMTIPGGDES